MVYEFTADDETTYTYGLRLISSDDYTYVLNAHGDVVALLNSDGEVTKRYEYDAFGNELNPDSNDTNPLRYCGEYFDKETGNIYLRARYYNPIIGRFSTVDPIRDGLNWYVYCANNPVLYSDPSGMSIAGVVVVSSPYWGPIVIKAFEAAIVTVVAGATAIAGVELIDAITEAPSESIYTADIDSDSVPSDNSPTSGANEDYEKAKKREKRHRITKKLSKMDVTINHSHHKEILTLLQI